MKLMLLPLFLFTMAAVTKNCGHQKFNYPAGCYKGKLVVKGDCMNYTIKVIGGKMDTTLMMSSWTDGNSGKSYQNVFALGSRCNFPATLREGDEFYFTLETTAVSNCAVCMAYYPVPPRQLSIKVSTEPCSQP